MRQAGPRWRRMHKELLLLHVRYGKRLKQYAFSFVENAIILVILLFRHFGISCLKHSKPFTRMYKPKEKYSAVFFKNCLIFQSRPSHTLAKELTAISFHFMLMQARQTILTVLNQLRMSLTFPCSLGKSTKRRQNTFRRLQQGVSQKTSVIF